LPATVKKEGSIAPITPHQLFHCSPPRLHTQNSRCPKFKVAWLERAGHFVSALHLGCSSLRPHNRKNLRTSRPGFKRECCYFGVEKRCSSSCLPVHFLQHRHAVCITHKLSAKCEFCPLENARYSLERESLRRYGKCRLHSKGMPQNCAVPSWSPASGEELQFKKSEHSGKSMRKNLCAPSGPSKLDPLSTQAELSLCKINVKHQNCNTMQAQRNINKHKSHRSTNRSCLNKELEINQILRRIV
jgi:hypothetical protein